MDHSTNHQNHIPPIPRQTRHQSRQRSLQQQQQQQQQQASSSSNPIPTSRSQDPRRVSIPPASPEVISTLITSLSVISKPASNHFEAPAALTLPFSVPSSPRQGSFGVDYGAYSHPSQDEGQEPGLSLDELAASPPVIRTAKPPSGFSPLTAPKSPTRESSGGLKSILRSSTSRPSSKGSLGSGGDTQSIGNLSIERGVAPSPELKRQASHDSWGKKQGRSHKGLMYMSSKERLREKEFEKKRASVGAVGGNANVLGSSSSSRPDPFLAETPITEEQSTHSNSPTRDRAMDMPTPSPRPIPTRDSSLRKTGSNAKRSSARHSRSKRDSDNAAAESIPEHGEQSNNPREIPKRRHHHHHHQTKVSDAATPSSSRKPGIASAASPEPSNDPTPSRLSTESRPRHFHASSNSRIGDMNLYPQSAEEEEDGDEGAPFPAVAQGRRRDASHDRGRRRSGRYTPDPVDTVRLKRSSSKLKRLSGPLSPRGDDKSTIGRPSRDFQSPEPGGMPTGYERPPSADSIDDAVESYLCSPRLSQKIKHPQTGRVISFSEVGDSEGSAVFCCVGMGLTRYITAFYDELALTLKLRLITPDRPGVGDSEPYADGTATPLSWPDDVYAICQALKINKFSILAHSAGAIYALATALRMPQHIRGRIHLLAPWIPPSQMNVFGTSQTLPPTNAIPTSQRILRALPTPILKAANSSFMTATSSSITSSLPKNPRRGRRKASNNNTGRDTPALSGRDRDNVSDMPGHDKENMGGYGHKDVDRNGDGNPRSPPPVGTSPPNATENMDLIRPSNASPPGNMNSETAIIAAAADAMADKERQMTYDTRLTHAIWELATTGANPAVDLLVCLERRHTIGFRYVDITRPVVIHHGSRDTRVPVENVKWLGKTMRRCEVRVLEGEGHGLMASAGVMGAVLMEISKEWEDWMRVTGTSSSSRNGERPRRGTLVR